VSRAKLVGGVAEDLEFGLQHAEILFKAHHIPPTKYPTRKLATIRTAQDRNSVIRSPLVW